MGKFLAKVQAVIGRPSSLLAACVLSFVAGSLVSAGWASLQEVHANENRVFELMIYHTVPGKVPALESIFRDVSRLQAQHNLKVLGYWVPNEDPAWKDTFVYIVEHPSREAADANWNALHSDPSFMPYFQAAEPLIAKANGSYHVDEVFMHPSEFSPVK
jgi:NIPSNAP